MADYATLLRDHITLSCRSINRIFLQAYVPRLQYVGQVCLFLNHQRGFPIPSSAAFGQIGEAYVAAIHRWAEANDVPIRYFAKGDSKEKIAEPRLRAAAEEGGEGRVVLIGIAQEKASAWRSWKKKGQEKASHPDMEWAARWRSSITSTSISGIPNGVQLSGRPCLCSIPDLAVAERPLLSTTPVGDRPAEAGLLRVQLVELGQLFPTAIELRGVVGFFSDDCVHAASACIRHASATLMCRPPAYCRPAGPGWESAHWPFQPWPRQ
jgi:hypothetical protein